jgi:zinc protease
MSQARVAIQDVTTENAIPHVDYEKLTLSNGLDLILHIDRKLPVVHVNQWFHVGSKNERAGRTGFAHLFEHMMFQGSKHAIGDYFKYVERAGANLREGGVNGTTDFDRTNYFATVPAGNLEYLLWVESDRLATLAEALSQEKLDAQREVVRNERRQTYENQPYGRAYLLINENLHPAGHPYSWDVIGSHADLIAASLDDVREFFQTFYVPNNLSLAIAGDFDRDAAVKLVESYFGSIPAGPSHERHRRWIPRLDGPKLIETRDRVPQDRTYLCWPAPAWFHGGDAELEIAGRILSDGLSSRLNRALVYDRQLCTNVYAFNDVREISGVFVVVATARPGIGLGEIEEVIERELRRYASDGPTEDELTRAKTKWEYEFISGLERIGGFGGKADRLNQYNTFLGDPGKFEEDVARIRSISRESQREAAREWLPVERRLTLRFHAEEESVAATTNGADRASTPSLGVDHPFKAPAVESERLDNGLELFVVRRTDLPKVAISLATRAGSIGDPEGKEGLAYLTAATIELGTPDRDALEIEDALGDLGTNIGAISGREYAAVGLDVLSRNAERACRLFSEIIRTTIFPEQEIARERDRHLDNLSQQANDPGAVASRIRSMLRFGRNHPYGRPVHGLPSTVRTIERDDLVRFHRERWSPSTSALIFAGDIDMARARELAEKNFAAWTAPGGEEITPSLPETASPGTIYLVNRPGAAQTVISQILPAPRRDADDYYAFRLVDAIWGGGGFRTRLNLNLREDKGYSYGVFSNSASFRHGGVWWSQGAVQTDKTAESLVEFVRELRELAGERPISEEELEDARSARSRGYSQQFETLGRIASQIGELWVLGMTPGELQREYDETLKASREEVLAAAQRYARPDEAILLLVGDLAQIEIPVRNLDLGEVVILDVEGNELNE